MHRLLVLITVSSAVVLGGLLLDDDAPRCAWAEDGSPQLVGADDCKRCHFKQHRSWKKSGFAKAFDALKPGECTEAKTAAGIDPAKDFTGDATCLKCHTTGYGTEDGYPAVGGEWTAEQTERAKNFEGVQCEACHGPGSEYGPYKKDHEDYKRPDIVALGANIPIDPAVTCQPCHVKECPTMGDDYAFDPAAKLEELRTTETAHDHVELKHEH